MKLVKNLVALGVPEIAAELVEAATNLLAFCKQYPWNSALHKLTEEIYATVLKTASRYPDDFKTAFLEATDLPAFIAELQPGSEFVDSQRSHRVGYMGSFIILANLLEQTKSDYVRRQIEDCETWDGFRAEVLDAANFNDKQPLAGHQSATQEDSDSDDNHYETSMDKLFATFTKIKDAYDSSRGSESNSQVEEEEPEEEVTEEPEPLDEDPVRLPVTPDKEEKPRVRPDIVSPDEDGEGESDEEEEGTYTDNVFWQSPVHIDVEDVLSENSMF